MERSVLLLYMSPFGKNPNIHTQTNEAAVLELKKHKEGPDCILALCSELVRTSPTVHLPDGKTCTTVEYFRDVFLPSAGIPAERLVVIPVPDSMDDKAQFRAISLLLGKIEAEDTLSIDLSGDASGNGSSLYARPAQCGDPQGDLFRTASRWYFPHP